MPFPPANTPIPPAYCAQKYSPSLPAFPGSRKTKREGKSGQHLEAGEKQFFVAPIESLFAISTPKSKSKSAIGGGTKATPGLESGQGRYLGFSPSKPAKQKVSFKNTKQSRKGRKNSK